MDEKKRLEAVKGKTYRFSELVELMEDYIPITKNRYNYLGKKLIKADSDILKDARNRHYTIGKVGDEYRLYSLKHR